MKEAHSRRGRRALRQLCPHHRPWPSSPASRCRCSALARGGVGPLRAFGGAAAAASRRSCSAPYWRRSAGLAQSASAAGAKSAPDATACPLRPARPRAAPGLPSPPRAEEPRQDREWHYARARRRSRSRAGVRGLALRAGRPSRRGAGSPPGLRFRHLPPCPSPSPLTWARFARRWTHLWRFERAHGDGITVGLDSRRPSRRYSWMASGRSTTGPTRSRPGRPRPGGGLRRLLPAAAYGRRWSPGAGPPTTRKNNANIAPARADRAAVPRRATLVVPVRGTPRAGRLAGAPAPPLRRAARPRPLRPRLHGGARALQVRRRAQALAFTDPPPEPSSGGNRDPGSPTGPTPTAGSSPPPAAGRLRRPAGSGRPAARTLRLAHAALSRPEALVAAASAPPPAARRPPDGARPRARRARVGRSTPRCGPAALSPALEPA